MFFGQAAAPPRALHSRKSGQRMFARPHPAVSKASVPRCASSLGHIGLQPIQGDFVFRLMRAYAFFLFRYPLGMFQQCLLGHRSHPIAKVFVGIAQAAVHAEWPCGANGPSQVFITLLLLVSSVHPSKQRIRATCESSKSVQPKNHGKHLGRTTKSSTHSAANFSPSV